MNHQLKFPRTVVCLRRNDGQRQGRFHPLDYPFPSPVPPTMHKIRRACFFAAILSAMSGGVVACCPSPA